MDLIFNTRTQRKHCFTFLFAVFSIVSAFSQNPIVTENALPGNPSSEWDISGAGDLSIQGFATDISVNKGQTVHFKIKSPVSYTIDIYRLGYYNGNGARKQGTGVITASLPQPQPTPVTDAATGLVDCGNWLESAHWDVPVTAVSGIYLARLARTDNGGASHIVFIVRDDASHSDLFFQTSDATWQAYNNYGGNSLYMGTTSYAGGHAVKVSYNRPFLTRNGGGGGGAAQDWVFNAEYPMIRFLEKNGYDITYTTNVDAARYGSLLLNHKIFLSVGHDEYWSAEQRANVEAARNAGVHLAFFSGNEVYWKTRWENSFDGKATAYRTLVCYKEGTLGENVCGTKCDPAPVWTGLWRDGCNYPTADGCRPENALTGQISWQNSTGSILVPGTFRNHRFWRNTSIAQQNADGLVTLPNGTLGHEWDFEQYADSNPGGRVTLSSTTVGGYTHKLSFYKHSSGAIVFGAGTIQWAWGLDEQHDNGNAAPSSDMQQATVNLLADMGVQPATLQNGLVAATASTDTQSPVTLITSHATGDTATVFSPVTIAGITNDANVVAGVEVSVDGGITWKPATGTTSWSFTWTPSSEGIATIKVRGFDDSGNIEVTGNSPAPNVIQLNIRTVAGPCSLFKMTDTPAIQNKYDNIAGIELGVRFQSKIDGYITALRFFKSSNDMGIHKGSLWTLGGVLLAQVTFTNESAGGWQEATLSNPVAISANTTYVASYNSPTGYYATTNPFFNDNYNSGPLVGIARTHVDGPNGVYKYSPTPVFPTTNYVSTNYWVDVVFNPSTPDRSAPKVISTWPADNATGVAQNSALKINFNESVDPATITNSTLLIKDQWNNIVPASVSYNYGLYQASITPVSSLNPSASYSIQVNGGVKDLAGNPLASAVSATFRTASGASTNGINDGPGGPILVITSAGNPFTNYTAEILRAEGLNEFATADISTVTASTLNNYDVAILGEMTVNSTQVTMLTNWVNAGGTLIAFKPSALLAPLCGLSAAGGVLSDKYLLINTASGPGVGIAGQTMQYHGPANLHTLSGATAIATLYSTASVATTNPAVTTINVGSNGGAVVAFTFDLCKSIIYTRQGNPAWAGTKRDGQAGPIRSDDMYFGNAAGDPQPDWVDFSKIAIPQADEQQRLLANIIIQYNLHRKPLPRFWYLPRGLKAAIVMTGDDHAIGGTVGRFNQYLTLGPNTAQDVADWNAVRGTSYIYPTTPITNAQIVAFQNQGFEIALHPSTGCSNFTPATLESAINSQLNSFATNYPGANAPVTNRTHCMAWSDWATHPKTEFNHNIRYDVNYYYWPGAWVQNRPGMFTGSGMPMRFADSDGTMIDCYQSTTQMTDESGIGVGSFCDSVLNRALDARGYYGVFTANMHTDTAIHTGSNAIIASAQARQIPIVSAKQMLTWIDGRNASSFGSLNWAGNVLSFTVTAANGSNNLRGMLPYNSGSNVISQVTRNGSPVAYTQTTIKGIEYAIFDASVSGNYVATYGPTTSITGQVTLQGRPAAPNAQWQVPLTVEIYLAGNSTPIETFSATTDSNGQFMISDLPLGTFNIRVKNSHTLARIKLAQTLVAGGNNIDFGTLLEGDVNGDNFVTLADLSLLINSFNKTAGDPGFDPRADLNKDGFVTLSDLSLLINNFNQAGEVNP